MSYYDETKKLIEDNKDKFKIIAYSFKDFRLIKDDIFVKTLPFWTISRS